MVAAHAVGAFVQVGLEVREVGAAVVGPDGGEGVEQTQGEPETQQEAQRLHRVAGHQPSFAFGIGARGSPTARSAASPISSRRTRRPCS